MKQLGILMRPELHHLTRQGIKTMTSRLSFNGSVGDWLYVKEPYRINKIYDHLSPTQVAKLLNGTTTQVTIWYEETAEEAGRLRSPLHMPKWAARTWALVTGIKEYRICQISDAECLSEGIVPLALTVPTPSETTKLALGGLDLGRFGVTHGQLREGYLDPVNGKIYSTPRQAFAALWDSIHAHPKWNPSLDTYISHPFDRAKSRVTDHKGKRHFQSGNPRVYGITYRLLTQEERFK